MNTVYQTKVVATGGRDGKVRSEDGVLALEIRVPQSMGGAGGTYTNPEQIFAAGYAACFDSALHYIARLQKVNIESRVTAAIGLQKSATDGFSITAALDVEIHGVERRIALDLLEKAHATCPYSKAIRNNVDVKINLVEPQKLTP